MPELKLGLIIFTEAAVPVAYRVAMPLPYELPLKEALYTYLALQSSKVFTEGNIWNYICEN